MRMLAAEAADAPKTAEKMRVRKKCMMRRLGLGWVEPPSERSERWRRYWVSEETRGMTGWETGFD